MTIPDRTSRTQRSSAFKSSSKRSRWRTLVYGVTGVALVLAALAIDGSPEGRDNRTPGADDARDAKALFERLKDAADTGRPQRVSADWMELSSLSLLGSRMSGVRNLSVSRGEGALIAQGSRRLPFGFWLNGEVAVSADEGGSPVISGRVGDLPLPAFVVHALISTGRWVLSWKGIDIPAPEEAIRNLEVNDAGVSAIVNLKEQALVLRSINGLGVVTNNGTLVAKEYCRLADMQAATPVKTLAETVQRTFSLKAPSGDPQAKLVALAMLVVTTDVGNMAGVPESAIAACRISRPRLTLLGRTDLAKHWALSAALAATLGENVSESLGAWKEVADSAKDGSGFSYVDLAADRAGQRTGTRLATPETALAAAKRLATATDEDLLPVASLALAEGMSEQDFVERYQNIESGNHAAVVARIDAALQSAGN